MRCILKKLIRRRQIVLYYYVYCTDRKHSYTGITIFYVTVNAAECINLLKNPLMGCHVKWIFYMSIPSRFYKLNIVFKYFLFKGVKWGFNNYHQNM